MKSKKLLVNLLLLLGTFLFSLLLLEVGFRLFSPRGVTKSRIDPDLGWVHVPNCRYVFHHKEFNTPISYNSFGMRDTEHTLAKPPGVFRIAVLGDSYMEGRQVVLDSVYSKVLERLLREKGINCETLNFGVHGYGTDQELVVLRKSALRFDPDLVILSLNKNDIATNVVGGICSLDSEGKLKITPLGAPLASRIRAWLYRNSHLFTFLNIRLPNLMSAGARKRSHRRMYDVGDLDMWGDFNRTQQDLDRNLVPLYAKVEDPRVVPVKRLTEAILREVHHLCQQRDVKFLLLLNSSKFQLQPQFWERKFNSFGLDSEDYNPEAVEKWLLEFAAKEGFPVLSAVQPFRGLKAQRGISFHWKIDGHWNPNGHREAARLTVEVLDSLGLPPS